MPLDHSHAFANGPVCPRVTGLRRLLIPLAAPFNLKAALWTRAIKAWGQFDRSAIIHEKARLGSNAWCLNLSGDRRRIVISENVFCRGILRLENTPDSRIIIHPNVYIGDDCLLSCASQIEIGSNALIAHGAQIFDNDSHSVDWQLRQLDWQNRVGLGGGYVDTVQAAPVIVGENTWIGCNSMIFKGVTIGVKSVVAAGSVVTKDVPPLVLVAGNPARIIKQL